jgi:hypothetical protein
MHAYQFGDAFAFQIESLCKGIDNETEYKGKGTGICPYLASLTISFRLLVWVISLLLSPLPRHECMDVGQICSVLSGYFFVFFSLNFPGRPGFVGQAGSCARQVGHSPILFLEENVLE